MEDQSDTLAVLKAITDAAERGGWEGAAPAIERAHAEISRLEQLAPQC